MTSTLAHGLDTLAHWRAALARDVQAFGVALHSQSLLDEAEQVTLDSLSDRLKTDKLVLAFVAEFSRGKSELINAIFFADTGRRVLPATPGRTTMCPVELRFDPRQQPQLSLLPIQTRLKNQPLAELREQPDQWQQVPLDPKNAVSLAESLAAVTRTVRVTQEQVSALGFWDPEEPDDNPAVGEDGLFEVPAWRHALINYPHPLLQRGLVVIDTPGLNAIGAEPELTLGLLPSAHAVVFVLGADTGVTRSDLRMWREHLGQASLERFVVMNKIDTLADPLLKAEEVQHQIEQQRRQVAQTLEVPLARVYPVSARQALAARVEDQPALLRSSRLQPLEDALSAQLMPRRQELLTQAASVAVGQVRAAVLRRLGDRQRQQAEQLMELRGLRGKSGAKLRMLVERVEAESGEFERCAARLVALRAVQLRQQKGVLASLKTECVRFELSRLQTAMSARLLNLGARAAFEASMAGLRESLAQSRADAEELRQMLQASFDQLNTEFGFTFVLDPMPPMQSHADELDTIERNYSRYLGFSQAWRMAAPGFAEQFRRMLQTKLELVFSTAAHELDRWGKTAQSQLEAQLHERRRSFVRRRESLQKVQLVAGDLEQRIAEVQAQDEALGAAQAHVNRLAAQVLELAKRGPAGLKAGGSAETAPTAAEQARKQGEAQQIAA